MNGRRRYLVLGVLVLSAAVLGGCTGRCEHRHQEAGYRDQSQDQRWHRPNRSHERLNSYNDHVRYVEDDGILE